MNGQPENEDQAESLIEQYKCYVATTDSTSDRRLSTNTFFLTLHTGVIVAAGYSLLVYPSVIAATLAIGATIMGSYLCRQWYRLLGSYRKINRVKFKVIGDMEKRLPATPFGEDEWTLLRPKQESETEEAFKEREKYVYTPLAEIEDNIPIATFFGYIAVAAIAIYSLICHCNTGDVFPNTTGATQVIQQPSEQ